MSQVFATTDGKSDLIGSDTIPTYDPSQTPISTPQMKKSEPKLANLVFQQQLKKKAALTPDKKRLLRVANALILAKKLKPAPVRETIKEKLKEAPQGCCKKFAFYLKVFYKELGLKHLTLVLFIIIYAFIGGAIFSAIEQPNEIREKLAETEKLTLEAGNLTQLIAKVFDDDSLSEAQKRHLANVHIVDYQHSVNLYPNRSKITWDLWGGVFYAGTIFTTIVKCI